MSEGPFYNYSHDPIVKREVAKLIEYVWVADKRIAVPYEKEIVWLRDCGTEIRLFHGGKQIGYHGGSYFGINDGHVMKVKDLMEVFKIDADSSLKVVVTVSVDDRPCFVAPKEKYGLDMPRYQVGMALIRDGQQHVAKPEDKESREAWDAWYEKAQSFEVKKVEVAKKRLWTSSDPLSDLKDRLKEYGEKVKAESDRLSKQLSESIAK